jgi:glutathionyl-hydroquinone reductase
MGCTSADRIYAEIVCVASARSLKATGYDNFKGSIRLFFLPSPHELPTLTDIFAKPINRDTVDVHSVDIRWNHMPSQFRDRIPSERFPAEKGRYVLYINYICPWAHRAAIVFALKGLGDVLDLIEVDGRDAAHGWFFSGRSGPERDPVYGAKWLKELYLRADPKYNGRITIPLLWDTFNGKDT